MRHNATRILAIVLLSVMYMLSAGCEAKSPGTTHKKLDPATAKVAFNKFFPDAEVRTINNTPIEGVYEIVVTNDGRLGIVYMDATGKFFLTGSLLSVDSKDNLTTERLYNLTKVDFNSIPLTNSITMGAGEGTAKVIVFTDPLCGPCALYHNELKKALEQRADLTVYLKLLPMVDKTPKSYEKSRTIACAKDNDDALKMLDEAFQGKKLTPPDCETNTLNQNMALASRLNIVRTPATIFQNGVKIQEAMPVDEFLRELKKRQP